MEDSQAWIFEKAKIFDFPPRVLKTVLNCRQKLSESCQFEKTRPLIHRFRDLKIPIETSRDYKCFQIFETRRDENSRLVSPRNQSRL